MPMCGGKKKNVVSGWRWPSIERQSSLLPFDAVDKGKPPLRTRKLDLTRDECWAPLTCPACESIRLGCICIDGCRTRDFDESDFLANEDQTQQNRNRISNSRGLKTTTSATTRMYGQYPITVMQKASN
ncbi:hypothetical protein CIHG_00937 [Coccidioides immitis H538.4]|uniref:Uncharacterized protein n=2 Tax=Coccidioides immitis TaxID=5501 RepID=A0A0J8RDA4_COCIT|nr:hypothetical protein CIRG_03354 [Coccidioides immitis RMSCC 2394]KMU83155.1 hypothetical protein CIHG_00937 [Coccidioides immitis H538.4]